MTAVTGSCSICKRKFEAPNPARLATILGSHRSWMHTDRKSNQAGSYLPQSEEEVRRVARARYYRIKGRDPVKAEAEYQARKSARAGNNANDADRRAAKNDRQRRYREMLRVRKYRESRQAQNGEQQFQRANMHECPHCHTRFYMVIPNEIR